jgi:hypothetical protein
MLHRDPKYCLLTQGPQLLQEQREERRREGGGEIEDKQLFISLHLFDHKIEQAFCALLFFFFCLGG